MYIAKRVMPCQCIFGSRLPDSVLAVGVWGDDTFHLAVVVLTRTDVAAAPATCQESRATFESALCSMTRAPTIVVISAVVSRVRHLNERA